MNEPTNEDCSKNKVIEDKDGEITFAAWYPQIGGYGGKCIVQAYKQSIPHSCCFDVWIWHDGEFPFSGKQPVELHHCMVQQFISFGELVERMTHSPNPQREKP